MTGELKAPFPWFGGKSRVADLVWSAIGPVANYIEPFAGSLAVLLMRGDDRWTTGAETVNDADCFLANFWRALAADPEAVAAHCDWPVNECDLLARHLWLVNTGKERIEKLEADPEFYDAKVAGWWVWGINSWIGSGWCQGNGPWRVVDGVVTDAGDAGRGVNRQLPHLGDAGQGTNRENGGLLDYFTDLAARLRRVRVCCGDWSRVVTDGAMSYGESVGVFLDPPYDEEIRCGGCYNTDGKGQEKLSHAVREWAIANGDDPRLRIVLCGYEEEHAAAMPDNWRKHSYSASKSYGTTAAVGKKSGNNANRHKERLWFSPHCLQPQPELAL